MNLTRLIKLKILNNELDTTQWAGSEKYFLSQFNDLTVRKNKNLFVYEADNGSCFFEYDPKDNILWCNYYNVWLKFEFKYSMSNDQIISMFTDVLRNKLGIEGIEVFFLI